MNRLRVIMPVRSRVASLHRFIEAFDRTRELPDTALTVIMDPDDQDLLSADLPPHVERLVLDPRAFVVQKTNFAAMPHVDDSEVLMFLGDDHLCTTPGWDRLIMEEFDRAGPGWVYVNDLGGREHILCTHCAISSTIIKTLGYFDEPSHNHYYVDNIWYEHGRALGRLRYLSDVVIDHLHPGLGRGANDELYVNTTNSFFASDGILYNQYMQNQFASDVAKLHLLLDGGD